jgi:hypothetical protein
MSATAAAAATTLEKVTGGPLVAGQKYRITLSIRAPYTIENIENLEARWKVVAGLNGNFTVNSFAVAYPNKAGVWTAKVDFTVKNTEHVSTGNFVLDGIAKIAQDTVSFIIGAGALILTTIEKFVVGVVGGVVDAAIKPVKEILNPGVLILAVVGIFLIVRR